MASSDTQRADQIAFHFYTKLFYVVNHARTTNPLPAKLDKWFNLETPDSELFTKEEREPYKAISLAMPPPPLEIQVLLTIPELTHNQVLVHISPDSSRVRIHPTPRFVLLESFVLDFTAGDAPADVPLPTIYKNGIPLFRSLYTLLRILPTWKLHKRLRRRVGGGPSLGITLRVRNGHDPDVLSLANSDSQTHTFPPVPHPMGSLALSATYLSSPTFQLDELESLLSSRFFSLDQRPFTPTLAKNQLRSSASSTSASASASPPRSPPRAIRTSLSSTSGTTGIPLPLPADRQGPATTSSLPRSSLANRPPQHQPRPSLSGASAARQPPLSLATSRAAISSGTGATVTSPSGLSATRAQILRQEHQQDQHIASSSSSLSPSNSLYTSNITTATQDVPTARRPQYPFPFKSNTVSAASSPGTTLPSSLGSGIPSSLTERLALYERERGISGPVIPDVPLSHSNSPHAGAVPLPSHARHTSLSRRSSLHHSPDDPAVSASASASASPSGSAPRKRYSSSFGHRYAPSPQPQTPAPTPAHASPQSPSPRALPASPSPSVTSFNARALPASPVPPARTRVRSEDEDISLFVQDIDMRKPLVGRARTPALESEPLRDSGQRSPDEQEQKGNEREREGEGGEGSPPPMSPHRPFPLQSSPSGGKDVGPGPGQAQSPPGGLMLTSEAEVDVRLRRMNETFLKSLEGLGGGREKSQGHSRTGSASGAGSGSGSGGGSRFSGARERERERERERARSEAWIGPPPGMYVRQGSEEVIGRMELDGEGEVEEVGQVERRNAGSGGGGRYHLF
ncbi:hypothetical protein H0H81_004667 [Sphagnurus paluster]|uniref:Autophagy-related protein 13 n=1 Tax=Sphagnurus paluster TaxID=117069 RepID=A0A9P7K5T2_9AGAR|nr:hypothetical protein H0H81_004667 [Sphagnurus paluster]